MRLIDALRLTFQALLFPQACVLCGRWVLSTDFSPLCDSCLGKLEPLSGPICQVCGVPLPGNILQPFSLCSLCRNDPSEFDAARAWGPYQGGLRRLIRAFKFAGRKRLAAPLSGLAEECFRRHWRAADFDWIVPVPLHFRRRRERGFDQTLLLARALSKGLGLPVCRDLRRVQATVPQSGLNLGERRKNLHFAFALRHGNLLENTSVLLVDDVLTTGTTATEASRILRREGKVNRVCVLTVARVARTDWL